ncbi:PadR family transcriptional regulator [Bacteroidota bacterium]
MIRGHLKILTLKALEKEEKTGYGLIKYIENQTGWKPSFGSIYPLLEHLTNDELVTFKEKENKKIYTLTKKGRNEIKDMHCQKKELMKKLQEAMNMYTSVFGEKLGKSQEKMMEMMKRGEINLEDAVPSEIQEIKELWADLLIKGKMKTQNKEISTILKRTIKELKKIK